MSTKLRQRGAALLLFVVILVLGASALVVNGLKGAEQALQRDAVTERALAEAKAALIGRSARDLNRPGSLPCPDTDDDGVVELLSGTGCPAYVGRLPWRTLGLSDLRDGNGERLWYALSPSFRDSESIKINSNTPGDIKVLGGAALVAQDLVALVIAPGRPLSGQVRSSNVAPDYVEFQSPEPPLASGAYTYEQLAATNDTILPISHRDLFTVVDQAVFARMQAEVVPKMHALANRWGRYPFPTGFSYVTGNPGQPAKYEGSLPWAYPASSPTSSADLARWQSPVVSGSGVDPSSTCQVGDIPAAPTHPAWITCNVVYTSASGPVTFDVDATVLNAGRTFADVGWASSVSLAAADWGGTFWDASGNAGFRFRATTTNSAGTLTLRLKLELAHWANSTYSWSSSIPPCTPPADGLTFVWSRTCETQWFLKNDWETLAYYAIAPTVAFGGGTGSLTVESAGSNSNLSALLVFAGRALAGQTRTSTNPADYFEGQNSSTSDFVFADLPRTQARNDRIANIAP